MLSKLRSQYRYLTDHDAFRARPCLTLARLVLWRLISMGQSDAVCDFQAYGFRLVLPPRWRGSSKVLYCFRERFEPELVWLGKTLGRGSVFVDVWADLGIYTMRAAALVGSQGRVLAFEPTSWTMQYLKSSAALNGLRNVDFHEYALSDHPGEHAFQYCDDFSRNSLCESEGSTTVSVDTLDNVTAGLGLRKVDCIKVDVEGAELLVLSGATKVILEHEPDLILEVNRGVGSELGLGCDDLQSWLGDRGYVLHPCTPAGELVQIHHLPASGNVVARTVTRAGMRK